MDTQKPPTGKSFKKVKHHHYNHLNEHQQYHQAKNNPIFCKCKAHISQVNELNSYINSITKKQVELERYQQSSKVNRTQMAEDQTQMSFGSRNKSLFQQLTPLKKSLDPLQQAQHQQYRDLLRDRMKKAKLSLNTLTHRKNSKASSPPKQSQTESPTLSTKEVKKYVDENESSDSEIDEVHNWQENSILHNEQSLEKFYQNYQQISKIQDIDSISPSKKNPLIEYLKQVNKDHQFPYSLAFRKKEDYTYNLKSFYINQNFAKAFSESLKSNKKLNSLILNRNKLNDESFIQLLMNLPVNLQRLDVSSNSQLTIKSYHKIREVLLEDPNRQQHLSYLNFEGNLMGDESCKEICQGLTQSFTNVRILNLSKNNITDVGAQSIAELINNQDCTVVSLLLHWNKIRSKGAIFIAKALKRNQSLQVFDASFNSFGGGYTAQTNSHSIITPSNNSNTSLITSTKAKNLGNAVTIKAQKGKNQQIQKEMEVKVDDGCSKAALKWKKALMENKRLAHLDLSFNGFRKEDVKAIGEGLKSNHTILGIHMMGNEAKVDELGFVDYSQNQDPTVQHVFTRIPPLLKRPNVTNKRIVDLKVCSNCWICEGWTQMEFTFKPQDSKTSNLHLSFENFKPCLMEPHPSQLGTFRLFRMIPPGNLSYFYSNTDSTQVYTDPTSPVKAVKEGILSEHVAISVPKINYIENAGSLEKFLTTEDLLEYKALPRPEPPQIEELKRPKSPWSLQKSIFGSYKYDTDEHLANCFDFDWRCSKIDKMIKSVKDKDKIYNFLNSNYRAIREAYKFFSALGPSGNIFSIGTNVFSDIIFNCNGLLDSKHVKLSDVDLEFISTKAGNQFRTKQNPDRQLIRFQFLEIFVRLALDKYYKSKICETYEESVKRVFEENVLPLFRKYNSNDFRWQRLWNEPCDKVIKKNLKTLKEIYAKHSGRESVPGEAKFMSMSEFIDMVTRSAVVDDNFGAREIGVIFNLSMMTQIDEINKERHFQMQFIEFVEALSRVADRVSLQQTEEEKNSIIIVEKTETQQMDQTTMSFNATINNNSPDKTHFQTGNANDVPLDKKIQEYINRLALYCMGEDYAYQFQKKLNAQENQKKKLLQKLQEKQASLLQQSALTQGNPYSNDKTYINDSFNNGRLGSSLENSSRATPMQSRLGDHSRTVSRLKL